MLSIKHRLRQRALQTIVPRLSEPIGVDTVDEFIANMGMRRIAFRAVQRGLIYAASGQGPTKLERLKGHGKRGLWLYFGEGQLGDALMDLAPRSMLSEHGYCMDLLTDTSLAQVFQDDPWFKFISSNPQELLPSQYDFAIVLSTKRRSIHCKRKYFKDLPWVSIHEDFAGPNFDRAGFSTQRLADLLGLSLSPIEFSRHANQKLRPSGSQSESSAETKTASKAITLCIGGVDPLRTYVAWPKVISELLHHGLDEYILVGSANGAIAAAQIESEFRSRASIQNWVGKRSILQSRELIAASRVVVSTDGGLLHLAATTATPIVGLFCSSVQPKWRLQAQTTATFLSSNTLDVNDISPTLVSRKLHEFLDQLNRC